MCTIWYGRYIERIPICGSPSTGWYRCFDLVSGDMGFASSDNDRNPIVTEAYRSVCLGFQLLSRLNTGWYAPVLLTATFSYFWRLFSSFWVYRWHALAYRRYASVRTIPSREKDTDIAFAQDAIDEYKVPLYVNLSKLCRQRRGRTWNPDPNPSLRLREISPHGLLREKSFLLPVTGVPYRTELSSVCRYVFLYQAREAATTVQGKTVDFQRKNSKGTGWIFLFKGNVGKIMAMTIIHFEKNKELWLI
ncbi:hypothetical protein GW17_00004271 [Ensete ventricosum]|nr:hypothetical protein GW17_00004271 [Ensete ventricosum]